jgi:hypothetical protein
VLALVAVVAAAVVQAQAMLAAPGAEAAVSLKALLTLYPVR